MDDYLIRIYNALMDNALIAEQCNGRIKFYDYPETCDVTAPYIVIDPLDAPLASDYADNDWLTFDYMVQIDVWSKRRKTTRDLSYEVMKALWAINFGQSGGAGDEYDKDTGIFRMAQRYRGKIYKGEI